MLTMLLEYRLIPLIIPLISLLIGCADDITQTGNTVTVHLTGLNGFDYPAQNSEPNVSVGEYPISLADQTGRCIFPNTTNPFNVTVVDWSGIYTFRNLSISNPEMVTLGENPFIPEVYISQCRYSVNLIPPASSQFAILRFISNESFFEMPFDYILYDVYPQPISRWISIPHSKNTITGKLLLIYCQGYFEPAQSSEEMIAEVTSFDSLAVKDITLHPGNNDSVSFLQNSIIHNLHQTSIKYTTQSEYYPQFTEAYFSFPGYSSCSDILFYRNWYPDREIATTSDLPVPCEIKMRSIINTSSRMKPQVIARGSLSTDFFLEHKQVHLLDPDNEQTMVNDNTIFMFDDDIEIGVYAIELDYAHFVFTDKKKITFGEMKNPGFIPERGSWYYWRVFKFSSFSNINDFLAAPFYTRNQFTHVSRSLIREFQTAE